MIAGVPIKTRVAPQVLDAAYAGHVEPEALAFTHTVSGWVCRLPFRWHQCRPDTQLYCLHLTVGFLA